MPHSDEHQRQARHNESLAERCAQNYPDWALTALFYAALHWAEAFFFVHRQNGEPEGYLTHSERTPAILTRISEEAYKQYRFLETSMNLIHWEVDRTGFSYPHDPRGVVDADDPPRGWELLADPAGLDAHQSLLLAGSG